MAPFASNIAHYQPLLASDHSSYYAPEVGSRLEPVAPWHSIAVAGVVALLVGVACAPLAPRALSLFSAGPALGSGIRTVSSTRLQAGAVVQVTPNPDRPVVTYLNPEPPAVPDASAAAPSTPLADAGAGALDVDPSTPITAVPFDEASDKVLKEFDFSGVSTLGNTDIDARDFAPGYFAAILIVIGLCYYLYTRAGVKNAKFLGIEINPMQKKKTREDFTMNYRPRDPKKVEDFEIGNQLEDEIRRRNLKR
uniref:Uncharacterized protein n=1 Tax=Eutreptiella gymnastica TaxID=73025 RepID=A0A7S1J8Z3_9EUGL